MSFEASLINFNISSHVKSFGLWKRRHPVLAYGFRLKVENLLTIIAATAVLHNIVGKLERKRTNFNSLGIRKLY